MKVNTKELNSLFSEILTEMGFSVHKKRTRGKSDCLSVYVMKDSTLYKSKKNMLLSNKTLHDKHKLDCVCILQEHAKNGWLPVIEDMSEKQIIEYCEKHSQ